jgi:hypothetical protein
MYVYGRTLCTISSYLLKFYVAFTRLSPARNPHLP